MGFSRPPGAVDDSGRNQRAAGSPTALGEPVSDSSTTLVTDESPGRATPASASSPAAGGDPATPPSRESEVARILRIRVPVIAVLATKSMTVGAVRRLSPGMIIEFGKRIEDPLTLQINNETIGNGLTVRCGENFGLRVTAIGDTAQRIRSLGA